jgi:ribosomal protein S18 acetylase RimI-like enzyme
MRSMPLKCRPYANENDSWRIRAFLRETYLLNDRRELNWQVYRFDYWLRHVNANLEKMPLEEVVFLWETADGRIAAVLNPDGRGDATLQVHPAWRTPQLEEEMIATAEEYLARCKEDGERTLIVWADSGDRTRQGILARRGYSRGDWPEYQRRRRLEIPIPAASLSEGYTIRPLGDGLELLERCYASGLAFHPDEIEIALDNRADVSWYRSIQQAPLYRRDLDLVCLAPGGEVAAFATIWFDDVTRTGSFEPVGTVPAHRRRGLSKALMLAGLGRLAEMGATLATVGSYSEAAGGLYASAGFAEYDLSEPWTKEIRQ